MILSSSIRCALSRLQSAALGVAASILLGTVGCFSSPPNTPPGALPGQQDAQSDAALEARVKRDSSDMTAWSELIRRRISERRFGDAIRLLDELIDLNANDYRAWLISADAYRSVGDLVRTEDHLFTAHNLAPGKQETNQALAGLFREVNLPESELEYWQKFARAFPQASDQRSQAQVAVASAALRADKPEVARQALQDVGIQRPGALALRIRLALADGGPDEALNLLDSLDDAQLEVEASAALLRLVPFLQRLEQCVQAEELCRRTLGATEVTQARMSALMALWELNFVALHLERSHADYRGTYERPIDASKPQAGEVEAPLMPPGAREIAARIDQIDPTQRDWVVRRWMAACVCTGQSAIDEEVEAKSRMQRLGWPSPPKPALLTEVISAWQVEDGLRLRAYQRAQAAVSDLLAINRNAELLLVLAQVQMEARDFDAALTTLDEALLVQDKAFDVRRLRLRWLALIGAEKPKAALIEMQASRKGEPQPAPASRAYPKLDASVLRAASLAVYHADRLGIPITDILPEAEGNDD